MARDPSSRSTMQRNTTRFDSDPRTDPEPFQCSRLPAPSLEFNNAHHASSLCPRTLEQSICARILLQQSTDIVHRPCGRHPSRVTSLSPPRKPSWSEGKWQGSPSLEGPANKSGNLHWDASFSDRKHRKRAGFDERNTRGGS